LNIYNFQLIPMHFSS